MGQPPRAENRRDVVLFLLLLLQNRLVQGLTAGGVKA
jgi:hypothetical protein